MPWISEYRFGFERDCQSRTFNSLINRAHTSSSVMVKHLVVLVVILAMLSTLPQGSLLAHGIASPSTASGPAVQIPEYIVVVLMENHGINTTYNCGVDCS